VVIAPADGNEVKNSIKEAVLNYIGPVYIRLSRHDTPVITNKEEKFVIGKGKVFCDGGDITLISTGVLLSNALKAVNLLKDIGINPALINMPTIKPIDKDIILKYAEKTKAIITIEENTIIGGLYSAVSGLLSQEYPIPLASISVNDEFGKSGSPEELLKYYKLTEMDILNKSLELIKFKKRICSQIF